MLRKVYLEKRKTLTDSEYRDRNDKLLSIIKSEINFSNNKIVHVFLAIQKFREVDTRPIIEYLKSKQQQIVLSKSKLGSNDMTHYLLEENTIFETNKWGITEPKNGTLIKEQELDVVFVPLLVFDNVGNRIGYGKGYYDKFLSKCKPSCLKIGLSLSPPLDLISGMTSMDVPLDYCVSPLGIHKFI